MLTLLTKILKWNSKNLSEQKNNTVRTCSKCDIDKPLDLNNFQKVKFFKTGYSFYCNECDKPPKKEE
jgi:hypothetical protein